MVWYANRLEMRAATWSSIPGGRADMADTGRSCGFAAPGVGYVSIAHVNVSPGFGTNREAFAAKASAPVAAALAPARTIIVDVRTNPGGSDLVGLAFAGCFTATPVPVLSRSTRIRTGEPTRCIMCGSRKVAPFCRNR